MLTNTRRQQLKEWQGVRVRLHAEPELADEELAYSLEAESRLDYEQNMHRLRAAKSWWPERLLLVLTGAVFVIWMWGGR